MKFKNYTISLGQISDDWPLTKTLHNYPLLAQEMHICRLCESHQNSTHVEKQTQKKNNRTMRFRSIRFPMLVAVTVSSTYVVYYVQVTSY